MNFNQYFESISRDVMKHEIPIKHARWIKLSFTLDSFQPGSYHLSTGVIGKKIMTSLDSAYNFSMSGDAKAKQMVAYICNEVKSKKFEGLTVRGIANMIDSVAEPIVQRFQKPEDTEGVEPDSGLADKINVLDIPPMVKDVVLENLPEIEEYLPKGLIHKPDEVLKIIVMKIYDALQADTLEDMIQGFSDIDGL